MTTSAKCHALAAKLGCELDIDRRHRTVTILLPDGMQIEGNVGLNCRVNNTETMVETWAATWDDLQELASDGMEPIAKTYSGCDAKTPPDQVICLRQGEYEVMVDGKLYGTWDSLDVAQVGLLVEQRRAANRCPD